MSVRVQAAGIFWWFRIGAGGGQFPAVSKINGFHHSFLVAGGEIILDVPVIIPTKTAEFSLGKYEFHVVNTEVIDNILPCICQTLKLELSLIMTVVFLFHMRTRPLLASMTR